MLRIFRSVFALYILAAAIGFVGFVASGTTVVNDVEYGLGLGNFECILIFLIWIISVTIVLVTVSRKKLLKINELMFDCKANEYVAAYEKLLKNPVSKKMRVFINLSLATGYIFLGDTKRLKQALDRIDIEFLERTRSGIGSAVGYYNHYILYYLLIGDTANAEDCLDRMKRAYISLNIAPLSKASYDDSYMNKRIRINIAKGEFDGAETHYKLLLETEKQKATKVVINYTLGKVYTHYGRTAEAKAAFSYCVEHGGDTIYVSKSKEKLI